MSAPIAPAHVTNPFADWDRIGTLLRQRDPHEPLRSIHNGTRLFDLGKRWVTTSTPPGSERTGTPSRNAGGARLDPGLTEGAGRQSSGRIPAPL